MGRADPRRGHAVLARRLADDLRIAPRGAPAEGYRDLIEEVKDTGGRVALDSEGERLILALTEDPDVVKLNVAEASELLRVPTARRDTLSRPRRRSATWLAATGMPGSSHGDPRV